MCRARIVFGLTDSLSQTDVSFAGAGRSQCVICRVAWERTLVVGHLVNDPYLFVVCDCFVLGIFECRSENDGGVNSDPVVRKFVEYFTVPHKDGWQNRQCYKNKDCVTDSRESKYSGSAGALFASETSRLAGQYTLSVFNPASHKGLRGVQVILQLIPMRKSKVQIDIREESAVLHTSNVKMLQLQPPDVAPIYWQSMQDVTVRSRVMCMCLPLCCTVWYCMHDRLMVCIYPT